MTASHAGVPAYFARAATEWAGGARGQVLVDAAARALADGTDSPTLRVLAGAPRANADEEATELAPLVFEELGLHVEPRLSRAALIEAARLAASDLVAGRRTPREVTSTIYGMYVAAGYPDELADFSGYDDMYDMLRDGIITGSVKTVDEAVMKSARWLASGEPRPAVDLAWPFIDGETSP